MADHPLRSVLTNTTYDFLGRQNRVLLDAARRDSPSARGAELATTVLRLLQMGVAREAARDGDVFYSEWLRRHGGERPRVRGLEHIGGVLSTKDYTLETEDFRWVGLAVLIALTGGALALLLSRKREDDGLSPSTQQPQSVPASRPRPLRFAVAAFSGRVRDAGTTAATAGDLLTHAAFWWVGGVQDWDVIVRTAGLTETVGIPDTDDALLVFVYEAPGTGAGTPSSRPEGATRLREAARAGVLRIHGAFSIGDPAKLSAAGFRR